MFRVVKRQEPLGRCGFFCIWLVSVLLALALCGAFLDVKGNPFWGSLRVLMVVGFFSDFSLESTALKAIPLFLCALGVSAAFRMRVWNIGAEGQFALGAIAATAVAICAPDAPAPLMLPLMCLAAILAGALWSLIPGIMKISLGINEIITTLMFNYIALSILEYLVFGPWRDPAGFGFPITQVFPDSAVIGAIWPSALGRIHWGVAFCLVAGLALSLFMRFTRIGFEITASGENAAAARYAGMPYRALVLLVMALCGALAGLAGCIEVSATTALQKTIMVGYGYTAIVVAWLARLNTGVIALGAVLLAGFRVGAEDLQAVYQVPERFAGILEGLLLLLVLAGQFFDRYRLQRQGGGAA